MEKMTYDVFVSKIDRCLEIQKISPSYQDEAERAKLDEEFIALFDECFNFGKVVLEKGNLSPNAKEKMSALMGKLNGVFPNYKALKELRTKNGVETSRAYEKEEDLKIKR